jgi:transcriptional regulator with XRE-family HTH domain
MEVEMKTKIRTDSNTQKSFSNAEEERLGERIREIRNCKGFTQKQMAEKSKLNINTLSMVEKGKTSPSIGTLQRLARALDVPIAEFFDTSESPNKIVFTPQRSRPETTCCHALIQNLASGINNSTIEPFVIIMEKDAGSGGRSLVHSGFEFAYCLSGEILYLIEEMEYPMSAGDSIVFPAQLSHRWENTYKGESQMIIVFTPVSQNPEQSRTHFENNGGE